MNEQDEMFRRIQLGLAEAHGVDAIITQDQQIELRLLDEDNRIMAFGLLNFASAGTLVDALNIARARLVSCHGFSRVGHA